MNGKVESCSNNQDEQDVNQDLKDNAAQVAAALDKKQNQRSPIVAIYAARQQVVRL